MADSHPNPHPNVHHRKIDLQSPADLTYLQANIRRAATQKLDLHFPPSAAQQDGGEDKMRAEVARLVEEFIAKTYTLAAPNITLNGLDIPSSTSSALRPPEEQYEPYDPALATRVASLYAELESLTTRVSHLRRTAPSEAGRLYADRLREATELDEKTFQDVVAAESERKAASALDVREPARWEEVRRIFGVGLEEMDAVGRGMGEAVGKVERARGVLGGVGLGLN